MLADSLEVPIETNAPYIPRRKYIAERGFGTIILVTRSLLLGAPHLPESLWLDVLNVAAYIRSLPPTDALGGKAPLGVWESKQLGRMKHMHKWWSLAFISRTGTPQKRNPDHAC